MRVLIADAFPADQLATLAERYTVEHRPGLTADDLVDAVDGFDVVVVRSTRVTQAAIEAGSDLAMVIRAGAGTNTIDTDAAAARGVYVVNVPGKNSIAVAELTMGLILAIDRNIPDNVIELRAGRWDKKRFSRADGLFGKSLGIVGLGSIGLEVAERGAAFGMRLLAVGKTGRESAVSTRAGAVGVTFVDDLDALLGESDIVSVHVPLADATVRLIDAEFLGACRDGAWIINTSRGEIVDEAALLHALDHRDMRAGLDVFADEPSAAQAEFRSALAMHPAVYGTHHIGASTEQAQAAIAAEVVALLRDFERGVVRSCVNLEIEPTGTCSVTVRHLDRVGVLSGVLAVLRRAEINVGQMENRIFAGSKAAVAIIRTDQLVTPETAAQIEAVEHVLGVRINQEGTH